MTSYSDKLIQKVQDALASGINETSVLYTFVLLNKAVQDSLNTSEFSTINLYRDWLVHTDLDRNKQLDLFFKEWDKVIEGIGKGSGKQDSTEASLKPLELPRLFSEMGTLGVTLGSDQRNRFVIALVNNLLDAPLRWSGQHIKEFRFTCEAGRAMSSPFYVCHMQIQHTTGRWFDGPELHFNPTSF